jgi:hypothetical protein
MLREILRVYESFINVRDNTNDNQPFYVKEHAKIMKEQTKHILSGALSDPPGIRYVSACHFSLPHALSRSFPLAVCIPRWAPIRAPSAPSTVATATTATSKGTTLTYSTTLVRRRERRAVCNGWTSSPTFTTSECS